METLYIIGGSGFIGKNMVKYYYGNFDIVVVDKYIDKEFFSTYPKVHTIEMDLVENTISTDSKSPDYIINLASVVTAERDLSLFDSLISSNLKVLMNLYNRFKDTISLKLYIQFGSSEEYGSEGSPFNETIREQPNSPYALVKQLTTNTAMMLYNNYKFPVMVVRPGNLFGPLQHKSKFIPYVIDCLQSNLPLNVSPCEQKRDFIYVEDFAFCIQKLMENHSNCIGQIVNVSSGESISLKKIIEFLRLHINSTSEVNYGAIPYRENEVMDLKCSMDKFIRLTKQPVEFNIFNRLSEIIKQN